MSSEKYTRLDTSKFGPEQFEDDEIEAMRQLEDRSFKEWQAEQAAKPVKKTGLWFQ